MVLNLIPSDAPSSTDITGVFGNHLFELPDKPRLVWLVRASLIAAREVEQRRGSEAAAG